MNIRTFKIRRKALSPVIAVLLMVGIAVAAVIITYVWAMGLLGAIPSSDKPRLKIILGSPVGQSVKYLVLEGVNHDTWTVDVSNVMRDQQGNLRLRDCPEGIFTLHIFDKHGVRLHSIVILLKSGLETEICL